MDQEIKQEFGKMTQEFENLSLAIKEGFDAVDKKFEDVESSMATKEDLKGMATKEDLKNLELKMIARFDRLEAEVTDIKRALCDLEKRVLEDTGALASDFLSLRARVEKIEEELRQLRLAKG